MNKIDGELISALLDGEIEPEAHQNTVSRLMDAGPEAIETYGRYRLIGDLMRDESALVVPVADEVHAALRDEPTVLVPRPPSRLRWVRPVAGVALAASVASVAVIVAPKLLSGSGPVVQAVAVTDQAPHMALSPRLVTTSPFTRARSPESDQAASESPRWQTLDADLEERLNRLVIEHHEFAGHTGINGPVPHVGFVSYDAR